MKPKFFLQTITVFIFLSCRMAALAQVCSGSLGDPVVNVTFGSGANTGDSLHAATTSYIFTRFDCPDDGSYTVVNATSGCFSNSWLTVPEDHTPNDANGYMMLVNASFNPGDFYVDTVKNLCSNTTYEFAAWIVNVLRPDACNYDGIRPNLTFNIETTTGTVLGTYTTGEIAASSIPEWKQYGLFFTTPASTENVVIRLTNTAPGGCGNDLALDDITFRPCGPIVKASVVNSTQTSIHFCQGDPIANVPLTSTIGSGYIAPAMQWQLSTDSGATWTDIASATSPNYLFNKTSPGNYLYRLTVAEGANAAISNCRVASNLIQVWIHDLPVVNASGTSPICERQPIKFSADGGAIYNWSGPAGFSSSDAAPTLVAKNNSGGEYHVQVTDRFGCVNFDSVNIVTKPRPVASVSSERTFCEGDTVNLLAGGGIQYLWSPVKGLSSSKTANPIAQPSDSTIYMVVVFAANDCSDTVEVKLNVLKKPVADAGPDKILLKGQSVILDGKASGTDISYKWSPGIFLNDPLLITPLATPVRNIGYALEVSSNAGCVSATDSVYVKVYNDIYIPNAFSPNNDGLNDTWRIDGLQAVPDARVKVYNRFGNLVFETVGNSDQWDGTFKGQPLSPGAYAYLVDLRNGSPLRKGTVIILR